MSKKSIVITAIIILIAIATYYFSTQKRISVENDQFTSINIKCPPVDYDWRLLHSITEEGLVIECPIKNTNAIILEAEQAYAENGDQRPIYKVQFSKDGNKLLLGTYPVFMIDNSQFTVSTQPNELIHLYDKQSDLGGFVENGWFVNTESNEFVEYSSNGRTVAINTGDSTYKIKYAIQDGDDSQPYGIAFGKDMIILGLMMNNNQVVSFNQPIVVKFDSSDELVPYTIPNIDVHSFNSSLNTVTIEIDDIGQFNIPLKNTK